MADVKDELIEEAKTLGVEADRRMSEATIQEKIDAVRKPPGHSPFAAVPEMIRKMAAATSIDLNKHGIQASILNRLENWAKKMGLDDEWQAEMPKHIKLIREVSEERYEKAERFKERNRLEKARLLARSELEAQ